MKRTTLLLTVLMACFIACVSANAAPLPDSGTFHDFAFLKRDGFTTEITDLSGKVSTFPGVLKVSSLEQHDAVERVASYSVCYEDLVILSVQLHNVVSQNQPYSYSGSVTSREKESANGFYSIELPIGDGTYTAFLTGLTPEYLAEMQDDALNAILTDNAFSLEDVSFIDTEKQDDVYDENGDWTDSDADMCWAASASNILFYTGWARQAGFGSADYMFEELIREFTDKGGHNAYGLRWFFNGYYDVQGDGRWSNDETGYDTFNGYLPDYCYNSVVRTYDLKQDPQSMKNVLTGLRDGCGVQINFGWVYNWQRENGHAVTLWGMVYRTGSDLSAKSDYHALIISDSDNSITDGQDRRTAPNTLNLYQITPVSDAGYDSWYFDADHREYLSGTTRDGILEDVVLLAPYSDSLVKDGGTKKTSEDPDLVLRPIITEAGDENNATPYFASDSPVVVYLEIENESKVQFSGNVICHIRVVKDGAEVNKQDPEYSDVTISPGYYVSSEPILLGTLDPGVYEVTASIETDAEEAYRSNNAMTGTFYVSERSRSQDTMSFTASAVFDGPPNKDYYGLDSIGRLILSFEGGLGYEVAQYNVTVEYDDGTPTEFYRGEQLPDVIYGLQPRGGSVEVSVYAVPKDPAKGYERLVGVAKNVELSYYFVEVSAEPQSFTPIRTTDTILRNNEEIALSFTKHSANKTDPAFLVEVCAQNENSKYIIGRNWIEVDKTNWYFWGTRWYDWETDSWENLLPSGTYRLTARTYSNLNETYSATYQSSAAEIGELVVLPTVPECTDIYADPSDPTKTMINYTTNAPEGSSFTVRICYGTDENMKKELDVLFENYSGESIKSYTPIGTLPKTTYYYRLSILVDDEEIAGTEVLTFTTPKAAEPEPEPEPETLEFTPLRPGGQVIKMGYGEEIYLETYAPITDDKWSFTFAGADGYVCVWDDEQSDWGERIGFGIEDQSIVLPLAVKQGQPVRLLVFAYVADDYQISYAQNEIVNYQNEKGIFVDVVEGEYTFVASYASTGRMLSARRVETAGYQFVSVDPAADVVRVFRLDHEYAPVGGAAEQWQ